jgi:hypothetical protein
LKATDSTEGAEGDVLEQEAVEKAEGEKISFLSRPLLALRAPVELGAGIDPA